MSWLRRPVLVPALSLALALMLASCTTTTAHPTPTPTMQGAPSGEVDVFLASTAPATGQPSGTTLSALRASDDRQEWTRQLTTEFASAVYGDGTLFGALVPLQSTGGSMPANVPLAALRGSNGTPQWQVTPGSLALPLGVLGSTVFAGQLKGIQPSGQVTDSALLALSVTDGHTLWSVDLGGPLVGAFLEGGFGGSGEGSVLPTNGTLLFLAVAPLSASGGPAQAKIMAVRASDGGVQWTRPLPQALEGVSNLLVGGGTVYVAGTFLPAVSSSPPDVPAVLALDASSGALRWTHQFTSPQLDGSPPQMAAGDQGVYAALTLSPQGASPSAGPTGQLVELSAQSGSQIWQAGLSGPTMSLVGGTNALYVGTQVVGPNIKAGPPANTITAFQASDGKALWSVQIASTDLSIVASVNGSLIVLGGSATGTPGASGPPGDFVEALSTGDGSVRWTVNTGNGGSAQVGTV
jgi:outer membrane protein assembly factor BamB